MRSGSISVEIGVVGICLWITSIALTIHGLYLAFSASVVLGIIALFVEPSPLLFSLVYLLAGVNLPEKIMALF